MQTRIRASVLDEVQVAQARILAYELFARMFLKGPEEDLLNTIQSIPELAQGLNEYFKEGIFELERAASDHYHLFHFNVFPYQSMFLDPEGSLGGLHSEQVLSCYRQAGFKIFPTSTGGEHAGGESPDHIGLELAFTGHITRMEASALQIPGADVQRIRKLQLDFFELHLLPWLPILVQVISLQGNLLYHSLAQLTQELVFEHYSELFDKVEVRQEAFALPPSPAILEDEKNGLGEIAAFLLTPVHSGIYLSRDDIARLGRRLKLPRGFGSRKLMLTNLLRSAVEYEQLPALIDDLKTLLGSWSNFYRYHLENRTIWNSFAGSWVEKIEGTLSILARLSTEARRR
jgi:putative dimethyl sulfoxide reductase chaperone